MSTSSEHVSRATSARGHLRYAAYHDLKVVYEGFSESIPCRAPDLSIQGMFINTARRFPEGAVLKLRFRLPGSNYEVQARGEVRYCLAGVGIGVEFVEISADCQRAIEQELLSLRTENVDRPR